MLIALRSAVNHHKALFVAYTAVLSVKTVLEIVWHEQIYQSTSSEVAGQFRVFILQCTNSKLFEVDKSWEYT